MLLVLRVSKLLKSHPSVSLPAAVRSAAAPQLPLPAAAAPPARQKAQMPGPSAHLVGCNGVQRFGAAQVPKVRLLHLGRDDAWQRWRAQLRAGCAGAAAAAAAAGIADRASSGTVQSNRLQLRDASPHSPRPSGRTCLAGPLDVVFCYCRLPRCRAAAAAAACVAAGSGGGGAAAALWGCGSAARRKAAWRPGEYARL